MVIVWCYRQQHGFWEIISLLRSVTFLALLRQRSFLKEKSTALGLPIKHSLNQSESTLAYGEVALIAIKA
jgi:hypothetical protein